MQTQDTGMLVMPLEAAHDEWCTYEISKAINQGEIPQAIYIGAERLGDLYYLRKLRTNTDFIRIAPQGPQLLGVRILATGTKIEMLNYATRLITTLQPQPRCNLFGASLQAATRPLLCSNGKTYTSQLDAAQSLGLNQSNISQHLRGKLKSVKGYTFAYA